MSGYFVDPTATRTVVIGPCKCPGTPHAQDEVSVRTEYAADEIDAMGNAQGIKAVAREYLRVGAVMGWNLTDDQTPPKPLKLTPERYVRLLPHALGKVWTAIQEGIAVSSGLNPDGTEPEQPEDGADTAHPPLSAVRSRRGTRASRSSGLTALKAG